MRKVIFMGTPQFAVPSLKKLLNTEGIQVLAVITREDKPVGRGYQVQAPPVKLLAEEHHVKCFQTPSLKKDDDLLAKLKKMKPDFFVTAAFGQILSGEVLKIPRYGTINVHASLLPEYRGANPIQRAVMDGKTITGITTMLTDIGLDTGDILIAQEVIVDINQTTGELTFLLSNVGADVLINTIRGFNYITPQKQDDVQATLAKKVKETERFINWKKSAFDIHNLVRGLHPAPLAVTYLHGKQVLIEKTSLLETMPAETPGLITGKTKEGIVVGTGEGSLVIEQLKIPGKKSMNTLSWANGARLQYKADCFESDHYAVNL